MQILGYSVKPAQLSEILRPPLSIYQQVRLAALSSLFTSVHRSRICLLGDLDHSLSSGAGSAYAVLR